MLRGPELKQARKEMGLTQKVLAGELGVSLPTVVNWESGKSEPRGKNLQKLNAFFTEPEPEDTEQQELLAALEGVAKDLMFDNANELMKTIVRLHKLGRLDL